MFSLIWTKTWFVPETVYRGCSQANFWFSSGISSLCFSFISLLPLTVVPFCFLIKFSTLLNLSHNLSALILFFLWKPPVCSRLVGSLIVDPLLSWNCLSLRTLPVALAWPLLSRPFSFYLLVSVLIILKNNLPALSWETTYVRQPSWVLGYLKEERLGHMAVVSLTF